MFSEGIKNHVFMSNHNDDTMKNIIILISKIIYLFGQGPVIESRNAHVKLLALFSTMLNEPQK